MSHRLGIHITGKQATDQSSNIQLKQTKPKEGYGN